MMLKLLPLLCGIIGLLFAFIYFSWFRKVGVKSNRNEHVIQSTTAENGVFYRKDWMTIIIVVIVLSVVIGISLNWVASVLYAYGALVSVFIELIGSHILNTGSIKFRNYIGEDSVLFKIGYRSGIGAGLFIASLGLLALGSVFIPINLKTAITAVACFGFGVSTIALFNETKYIVAADVYDSYIGTLMSAILLSDVAVNTSHITSTFTVATASVFPLIIAGAGVIASIIGSFFVRRKDKGNISVRINVGTYITAVLIVGASIFLSDLLLQSYLYAVTITLGIICGLITGISSAKKISFIPVLAFAASFILSYKFIGIYGLVLDAVGFISMTSVLVASSSYGLVTNTDSSVVRISNGYATCASALTVLALFVAYTSVAELSTISISDPNVLVGLFIGVMMPMVYASIFARKEESEHNFDFIMRLTSFIFPAVVGFLFGAESLGAFLGGLIAAGMVTSLVFNNLGITQENKDGNVVSISASINTMIKYMTAFSLVFAPVFMKFGGLLY